MRRTLCLACLVLPLIEVLGARDALAGSCDKPLVSACINSDTFWPTGGPSRFASLPGTLTTARNQFGFGLVATYQMRPIVLDIPSPGPTGTKQNAISDQVNGNFVFGYGVTDRLELHVALPVTFAQAGSGTSAISGGDDLRDTAMRDLRFGLALALLEEKRVDREIVHDQGFGGAVTARFDVSAPTGDRSQFAGESGGVFAPSIAFGGTYDRFFAGGEIGARLRGVSKFSGARIGTQAVLGLGVGAHILPHELFSVSAEARGLPTFTEQHDTVQTSSGIESTPNGTHVFPAEWLLGLRSAPTRGGDFVFSGGFGTGIPIGEAVTRPRIRAILGVTYAPRGLDSDGDGVLDRDDACPGVAGVKTVPETPAGETSKAVWRKGCPKPTEEEAPPVDFSVTPPGVTVAPTGGSR